MFNEGETIETIDIKQLVRPVKVFDLTDAEENISYEDIKDLAIEENDFVIFKTKNSWDEEFNFEFIYVAADAAKHLAEKKIAGVAIDALGIERAQEGHPTHRTLMGNGAIIMEGLRLKDIEAGQYFMVAAPSTYRKPMLLLQGSSCLMK